MIASLAANLGLLAGFKYTRFVVENFCGLTGWTAAALGRAHHPAARHQLSHLPGNQLHAGCLSSQDRGGPIVHRFRTVRRFLSPIGGRADCPGRRIFAAMTTPPRPGHRRMIEGLHYFILGMFKKVFIADRLAGFVDLVFKNPTAYGAASHRWAVLAYACQIYCDFSGYSDIAVGCAKWFGFDLPENFRLPYLSRSIAEFWRRWHITLSTWMRDYLYISLGGSRRGGFRTIVNLMATMTLCGLWHGASWNYVLWGFYNGVLLTMHRIWDRAVRSPRGGFHSRQRGVSSIRLGGHAATSFGRLDSRALRKLVRLLAGSRLSARAAGGGRYAVPAAVPMLVGLVAIGHWLGGCAACEWCSICRRRYVLGFMWRRLALVVVLGPDAGKPFHLFQF